MFRGRSRSTGTSTAGRPDKGASARVPVSLRTRGRPGRVSLVICLTYLTPGDRPVASPSGSVDFDPSCEPTARGQVSASGVWTIPAGPVRIGPPSRVGGSATHEAALATADTFKPPCRLGDPDGCYRPWSRADYTPLRCPPSRSPGTSPS